ncbi:hypothetical protein H0H87_003548 [Tephrocybe sp. NHM501043]|nr:hypothetical protein H0H87_003548 [Tephrocybe sp. NHM501043]
MPRAVGQQPTKNKDDFTFFWTTNHINGWASQWFPAPFTASVTIDTEEEEVHFPTTEHWMMLQKALLFHDIEIAQKVIASTSTQKRDMKSVKSLGRKVKNFDDEVWKSHRRRIVFEGNLHKYQQNGELKRRLLATGNTEIAEAAPRDRIWGIGFGEKNAPAQYDRWGQNLLGKALVQVRQMLRDSEERTKSSE